MSKRLKTCSSSVFLHGSPLCITFIEHKSGHCISMAVGLIQIMNIKSRATFLLKPYSGGVVGIKTLHIFICTFKQYISGIFD